MLQYLIILLDDIATSFCHYTNEKIERNLISFSHLNEAILFSLKRNLMLQFVYPDYTLPQEYIDVIETVPHCKISSSNSTEMKGSDIVVMSDWRDLQNLSFYKEIIYVWRAPKDAFFNHYNFAVEVLDKVARLNIIITDIETFGEEDFAHYQRILNIFSDAVAKLYKEEKKVQLNMLTDRMMLEKMNNCNAGWESVTLAPDGKFYVCPAFYHEGAHSIGDLRNGLDIRNPQLYRLDHAPLCRDCDSYQCQRCIWLNNKTTMEVNTPSHEQCVVAHLERNTSKSLLEKIRQHGIFSPDVKIKEIDYLDPFEVRKEW